MPTGTQFVESDGINIAYQVVGEGPLDLLYVPGWVSHVEWLWEGPASTRFIRRLSSIARVILMDKRGTGLSDRVYDDLSLESQAHDVEAVLNAVGSERAALFGVQDGGSVAATYAVAHPERVAALILYASVPKFLAADDYPWGMPPAMVDGLKQELVATWGQPDRFLEVSAPSLAKDPVESEWWLQLRRLAVSRGAIRHLFDNFAELDVRDVFSRLQVPTLILHRRKDRFLSAENAREAARLIPSGRLVELEGADHTIWAGAIDPVLEEVSRFLLGDTAVAPRPRALMTVVDVHVVENRSAKTTSDSFEVHSGRFHEVAARLLGASPATAFGAEPGAAVAAFPLPRDALQWAQDVRERLAASGASVRAGIHTGEVDTMDRSRHGTTFGVARALRENAGRGQIRVSRPSADLLTQSGLAFDQAGPLNLGDGARVDTYLLRGPAGVADHPTHQTLASAGQHILSKEGDYWSVTFEGRTTRIKDSKGIVYLARLLANPAQEVHALDLAANGVPVPRRREDDEPVAALNADAGPMLDAEAKRRYRTRIEELRDELREAEEFNDRGRGEAATAELETLMDHLASAVGLGGRDRRAASTAEKARVNVTKSLRSSISRLGELDARLGQHLDAHVRTGSFCIYKPPPGEQRWMVSPA